MTSWTMPVQGPISYGYGVKDPQYAAGYHTGVDFGVGIGTAVAAAGGGKVIRAGDGGAYGNYVVIDHGNGIFTLYAHLSKIGVKVGDQVSAGQQIGASGESGNADGPHLHFEVMRGGSDYGDEINPLKFLNNHGVEGAGVDGKGDGGGQGQGNDKGNDPFKTTKYDYGFSSQFLDAHPEIAHLVEQAIKHEWSVTAFQGHLMDTAWWKKHTDAQQQWQTLVNNKPAQAQRALEQEKNRLDTMAQSMGVDLSARELDRLAHRSLSLQLSDLEVTEAIAGKFGRGANAKHEFGAPIGSAGTTISQLKQMADEYAIPLSARQQAQMTRDVLAGKTTVQDLASTMAQQAKALFPGMADVIDRGYTVRQYATPYLNQAQDLLGINADGINLRDPKWSVFLTGGKDGGPMSMDEANAKIKSDAQYGFGNTLMGRSAAASLGAALAQAMGKAG